MIKIETMSDDCVATINGGDPIFLGQLFTSRELATMVLTKGELMYTVDELEMVRVKAKVPELAPASANSTSANSTSANSTSANSTSANSTSANSTSANSTSANSTSANSTSANSTSANSTSANSTSAKKSTKL